MFAQPCAPVGDAMNVESACDFHELLSGRADSNRRLFAWEANALPTELLPHEASLRRLLLELRPAKLFGGAAAMAICAANIALRDFEFESGPGHLTDEPRDRTALLRGIPMVEFENDRILLAAVNAGMGGQIVEDLLTALLPIDFPMRGRALQIRRTIPSVVFA